METLRKRELIGCLDCDLLQSPGSIPEGSTARCVRCGGVLRSRRTDGLRRCLALSMAAVVLFLISNTFPFLAFEMKGQVTQTTLLSGVRDLYNEGFQELSVLVLATSVVAPFVQILLLIYVLLPLHLDRVAPAFATAARLLSRVQPWSMMEVFMVGILVSIVKLQGMHATIVPGLALWSFATLMVVLTAALSALDLQEVWERAESHR